MADDFSTQSFCLLVFASTVWFWRSNSCHCVPLGGGVVGQDWLVSPCYGGHSIEETPGSIPNPEAKLDCADGTALGRVWESRSPPDIFIGKGGGRRWDTRESVSPSPPFPFFMPFSRAGSDARPLVRGAPGCALPVLERAVHSADPVRIALACPPSEVRAIGARGS